MSSGIILGSSGSLVLYPTSRLAPNLSALMAIFRTIGSTPSCTQAEASQQDHLDFCPRRETAAVAYLLEDRIGRGPVGSPQPYPLFIQGSTVQDRARDQQLILEVNVVNVLHGRKGIYYYAYRQRRIPFMRTYMLKLND